MKNKIIFVGLMLVLISISSFALTQAEAQTKLDTTSSTLFNYYLCIGRGTTQTYYGTNFILDIDISDGSETNMCYSERLIGCLLGKCVAENQNDIFLEKLVVENVEEGNEIKVNVNVRNNLSNSINYTMQIDLYNPQTNSPIYTNTDKTDEIPIEAGAVNEIQKTIPWDSTLFTIRNKPYYLVAKISPVGCTAPACVDNTKNNAAVAYFTIYTKQSQSIVPDNNILFAPVIAFIVLLVLRKRK